MSKYPSANIFLPAVGVAALVIGLAYGFATKNYGQDRIELLESNLESERDATSARAARLGELESAFADLKAQSETQLTAAKADAEQQIGQAKQQIATLQAELDGLSTARESTSTSGTASPVATAPAPVAQATYGLGRVALAEEIAAWDVDVLPDGRGLPVGSGDVWTGEEVFGEKCASCHGDFAEGRDAWPVLAGGFDTLDDVDPVKTVGSYWPYLSTVWDYVHRSMPFGNAGTLTDDEVYAITAYILYSNDLVEDDFTLSNETFLDVEMINTDGFVVDDRAAVEYATWRAEPCMSDCKPAPAEITRRSTEVGVTPADDGSMVDSPMEIELATLGGVEWGKERVAGSVLMGPGGVVVEPTDETKQATEVASVEASATVGAEASEGPDPALVAKGEVAFKKCQACHQVGEGAKNRSGPHLNGVFGRTVGAMDGFRYSSAMKAAHDEGAVWTNEALSAFLSDPRGYFKGTKMSFRGFKNAADVDAVIAYLQSFDQ